MNIQSNEEIVLSAQNLQKKYGSNLVINDASFELERGKIYGFIGQNGAGKTTIIRMLAGYAIQDSGEIKLFGESTKQGLSEGRKKVGFIVENPALYTKMNAYDNIEIQKTLYGIKDDYLTQELLELVGLSDVGKRLVRDYSLGMRQRLAIAMVLVNNPEILVLDEPVNGLDPMGIVELRELLLKLNKEKNITILISSHILAELYQLATDYIIINKGKIVEKLTLRQLDEKCASDVVIQTEEADRARTLLQRFGITEIESADNGFFRFRNTSDVKMLAQAFLDERILLTHFSVQTESLENYFVNLVGGADNE